MTRNAQALTARVASVIATITLATTACSGQTGDDGRELIDRRAAQREYDATARRLALPKGATFPASLPKTAEKTLYEPGYATSVAENVWICAWTNEWLGQRAGDRARATAALSELEKAPQTEFMSEHLDAAGREFFDDYLAKARLDDPSGFERYLSQNCR